MASQDWLSKDFYAVLGVPKDADAAAIKKAYRKLARKSHPDQNAGDTKAEERFKEIGEAYAVLSDSEQRHQYDQLRAMASGGARFTAGPGGAGGFEDIFSGMFGGGGNGGNVRFSTSGGRGGTAGSPDLQDLLGGLFTGGADPYGRQGFGNDPYGGFGGTRAPRRGSDIEARATLAFRQAVEGDTVTLATADGAQVTTRIPPGVKDGQKIRLRGKGHAAGPGGTPGDLMLTISVTPHPVFGRDGDNLTVDLPVTFAEAVLGATVSVPTLTGEPVRVRVAPGTPSGRVLRIKGRGVTRGKVVGDLLAKVQVVVPQRLTDEARAAVETLQTLDQGFDPRAELAAKATRS